MSALHVDAPKTRVTRTPLTSFFSLTRDFFRLCEDALGVKEYDDEEDESVETTLVDTLSSLRSIRPLTAATASRAFLLRSLSFQVSIRRI